jgi:hypothetical protein
VTHCFRDEREPVARLWIDPDSVGKINAVTVVHRLKVIRKHAVVLDDTESTEAEQQIRNALTLRRNV